MPNMKQQVNRNNAKILKSDIAETDRRTCNCREGRECPLNGNCFQKNVVHQADVHCNNTVKTYYNLTEQEFKSRWNNHNFSLRNANHPPRNGTFVLCLEMQKWQLKPKNCVVNKGKSLMADPEKTLNKRDEKLSKCKHKQKYVLATVKPSIIANEPPDPTWMGEHLLTYFKLPINDTSQIQKL